LTTGGGLQFFLKSDGFFHANKAGYCFTLMQIKLFTIPVGDGGASLQEMNTFLKAHKILEIQQNLISNDNGGNWCFCVRYVEEDFNVASANKPKVDYRQALDEQTFRKFAHLREIRKKVAASEGLSAFIVFTDEELAELAKLEEITIKSMLGIKGIGEKKVERFAHYFIEKLEPDEAPGAVA
jgi:superfamily II DNA helicase RecQ